jgi:uncharacterized membrane protein YbaN (DUF454 family)
MKKNLKLTKNKFGRFCWFIGGMFCTGLGIAGYILPIMPGTTCMLLALYCFAKSSEKWHNWILTNKYFGQTIRDVQEGKGMTFKAKRNALIFIGFSISTSVYFASNIYVVWFLLACAILAITMVLKQKTKTND